MEFLTQNHINTSTQIAVNNSTATAAYVFSADPYFQFYSDGMNNDLTTVTMTITFDTTMPISRIGMLNHNLKAFTIYYNGATANTFSFSGGATTTSSFTSNSETSQFFRLGSTVMCSSVTIDMKSTQIANSEKLLSQFVLSDLYFSMSQIPNASGYTPNKAAKQVAHTLSDGGTRIHKIREKWEVDISIEYILSDLRASLKTIYDLRTPFMFCPFGTSTSWDGILFEAVWPGDFKFYKFSDNAATSGFSGTISLRETPT